MISGFKLVSGEELIANVTERGGDTIHLKDPLLVVIGQGPTGLVANFMPWSIVAEGEIEVEKHAIAAHFNVPKDVENNYIQNTTGLQIVSDAPKTILKG